MIYEFLTGNYTMRGKDCFYHVRFDSETGKLSCVSSFRGPDNPSWLTGHPNGRILYSAEERNPDGGLAVFSRIGEEIRQLCSLPSAGADPCHLSLDDRAQFLMAANYSSGSCTLYRLDEEGLPLGISDFKQHTGRGPNPFRQECAHVHFSRFLDGGFYVSDLGMDQILFYELDREKGKLILKEDCCISIDKGAGPRHFAVHPAHPGMLYVLTEMAGAVFVFEKEQKGWLRRQVISSLPEDFYGFNNSAAVKFSEDGAYLFTSDRGRDSVTAFCVGADGLLGRAADSSCGGSIPRDMGVFGDNLIVCNQESDLLSVLHFDRNAGKLYPTGEALRINCPVCIMPL
jgi:6-phosphogluconolactonase